LKANIPRLTVRSPQHQCRFDAKFNNGPPRLGFIETDLCLNQSVVYEAAMKAA
jgi:hypothetical protein